MKMRRASAVVVTLLVAVPGLGSAQSYAIDRGSLIISGGASATSFGVRIDGEAVGDRQTQLSLAPSIEYFIAPGLAVGGRASLSWSSIGDDASSVGYGVGPKATYYFGHERRTLYPYIGASGMLFGTRVDEASSAQFGFEGMAGGLAMLSSTVGVNGELFLRALYENPDNGVDFDQNVFGFRVGVAAFVF